VEDNYNISAKDFKRFVRGLIGLPGGGGIACFIVMDDRCDWLSFPRKGRSIAIVGGFSVSLCVTNR
jgi:hypothetical protein